MTANELRIGNIVKHYDEFVIIEGIQPIHLWCNIRNEPIYIPEINPVKLTPEILEKAGFVKSVSSCIRHAPIWSIQVANNTSLYYDPEQTACATWYLSHEWDNNHYMNDFWNEPKYFHQLQNLYYSLSGEELNIQL